jgi:hypothetical protein
VLLLLLLLLLLLCNLNMPLTRRNQCPSAEVCDSVWLQHLPSVSVQVALLSAEL